MKKMIRASIDFDAWYDALDSEDQNEVDDMADEMDLPTYDECTDGELSQLKDAFESRKVVKGATDASGFVIGIVDDKSDETLGLLSGYRRGGFYHPGDVVQAVYEFEAGPKVYTDEDKARRALSQYKNYSEVYMYDPLSNDYPQPSERWKRKEVPTHLEVLPLLYEIEGTTGVNASDAVDMFEEDNRAARHTDRDELKFDHDVIYSVQLFNKPQDLIYAAEYYVLAKDYDEALIQAKALAESDGYDPEGIVVQYAYVPVKWWDNHSEYVITDPQSGYEYIEIDHK